MRQAARLLVDEARMEADLLARTRRDASPAMLREIISPASTRPVFQRKVWQYAAVLAVFLLGGGIYSSWIRTRISPSFTPSSSSRSSPIVASRTGTQPNEISPGPADGKPLLEGPEVQELLARYRLPDGAGFRGEKVSLKQAVTMVEGAIRSANVLKNPALKPLRIQIENPDGLPPDRNVSFRAGSVSAVNLLKALAAMADAELSFGPDRVFLTLKKISEATEDNRKITTRVFRVPPDFAARVMPPPPPTETEKAQAAAPFSLTAPQKIETAPGGFTIRVTPAPPPTEEEKAMIAGNFQQAGQTTQRVLPDNDMVLKEFARLHGLPENEAHSSPALRPQNSGQPPTANRMAYSVGTSRLVMTAAPSELDRAEAAIEFLFADNPPQIFLSAKLVELPDHWETKDQILEDHGLQQLMRSWSQQVGVDLMSAPSVIVRNGQRGLVEIVKDAPQPDGSMDWTGVKLSQKAVLTGEGIALDSLLNIGEKLADGIDHREVEVSALLRDGQTAVFLLTPANPGRQVVGFVTATLVDSEGGPLGPKIGSPANSPPPEPAPGAGH